ncbi:hypothetical protein HF086_013085 [Spodoptera exigua]|uniref:non-specific serine/threonine protein kinase n=1 Tax=Spodoptera exigua TaxID=7107 RepID=A0A922MA25_SPOEX|nr:hypothetical protein HF086_013085 [Spodoptera exigua]
MELEISVKEASSGLKSVRVTERKKNAELLKEFLTRNAVPSLLTDNTIKKKGYTWNNLFDDINEYILKEIEKFETSKTYESTTRPLCTSLLHQCMAGANKGKAYIKTDKIVEICLYILRDSRMVRAIGDCYLNLLLKHFLPYEHYLDHVTPNTWKELLDVCIDACSSNDYKLDNFTKLRLVLLVMKSGKENCQFVKSLMESLPSLEEYFLNISNDKKVQDVVIEILTLLLETLSCEYRLTMCQFTETLMPSLLKFYDQNKDQKKKIFELSQRSDSNENVSKRLKMSINKNKRFGDLVNELQQNHVPCNLEWNTFEQLTCLVLKNSNLFVNKNVEFQNAAVSLWNSCVRNCTAVTPSHKAIQVTMQYLIHSNILEYTDALHLIKLYLSNDMPITNNSVQTLCATFYKFYSKCSMDDFRCKCLSWLTVNETPSSFVPEISELLFRLVASENILFHSIEAAESESDNLRKILYYNTEKCILFSEFEIQNSVKTLEKVTEYEHIGTVCEIEVQVNEYIRRVLVANNTRQLQTETDLIECMKLINISLQYLEKLLKYNLKSQDQIECSQLSDLLTTALTRMSTSLNSLLGSNSQISCKLKPLELLREILVTDFNSVLARLVRASIDADLFHTINNILNIEVKFDECDIIIDGDQDDVNMNTLKHNCFLLLAAYCTKESEYQEELLKLILDENIYNFKYDIPCIFQCIELLIESKVENPPLGLIFSLMQHICQKLYRNSKVSYEILKVLLKIMDPLCEDSNDMKKNCLIMIKSYWQLCDSMFYPPKVAALIYECITKIVIMNQKQSMNIEDSFEEACMNKHLTDGNVLQYLCKDQTVTIFKILFELWKAVTQESIFELKVLALHAYVTFIRNVPLGHPSDAFMCNFACNSFTQAIKHCSDKKEMKAYIDGLNLVLSYLLPEKAKLMQKSLLELLPALIIKKESDYEVECTKFLNDLNAKMRVYLNDSEDVVDFISSMTQDDDYVRCANSAVFKEKLKTHRMTLNRPSHETLLKLRQFLSCNKEHVRSLYCDLESKTFSEDCLEEIDRNVLEPFSSQKQSALDTVTDSMAFEEYCLSYPEGVFLNCLLTKDKADWLKEVTCTLLQFVHSSTNYVNNLRRVCALKPHLCRKILPALVGLLLQGFTERHIKAISDHIKKFFNNIWEQTFDEQLENSGDSNFNARTDGTVTQSYKTIIQYMLEIVDFVAWAAAVVDQNWAAVYYGELWAVFQNGGVSPSSPETTSKLAGGKNLQRIFRKCYVSIGEVDAIEGCGTEHLTMENEKRKHLINTGQFTDALLMHDIALSCGGQGDQDLHYGVVRSLHKSGMHHLALSNWSHFVDIRELSEKHKQANCNQNSVVKAFQYACLKSCLNVQTTPEFENKLLVPLNKAKLAVSRLCHNLNMENCQNIYKVLEKLHIFNDIEDYFSVRMNRSQVSDLLRQWDVDNLPPFIDFKHIEALSSQRVLILEHAARSYSDKLNEIVSLQIQYAQMALNNRRVQMAQRLLAVAKKCKVSEDVTLVESEIAWAKGHKEIALSLLRNIVTNHTLDAKLAAMSLRRYALWMAESKRDNPREIIHKYLQKSLDVLGTENVEVRLKVYYDIAKFADAEYKQVVAYMSSSTYENRVKCLENMKGTASSLGNKSAKLLTKEEGRALLTNRKFKELDEAEIANAQVEKDNFLQLAMRYYLLSLKQCDENNLSVFRVISLWLANQDFEFDAGKEKFEELINMIPSWKFVTVLPQLTPRLTDEDTPFITILKNIIKRCAVDHPHHTLPILFGIKNSDKDNVIMNASGRGSASGRGREQQPRVVAAQALVQGLRTRSEQLNVIMTQMEKMCDALHAFDNNFELVGGVNCPKKINCQDNTGRNHILLIKGGDDLKQDAVMQQVFTIVNTLLEKNPVTNKNKLHIRTYKVVPMSRLSGVLEWCEGTIPMGMYLVGLEKNSGAHARYRPQDISCEAARSKMIESANDSHESKLNVYNKIVKSFKPVFHYFFTERYLDPVTWYERRLAYTKSVATSSMVGYILGLGDRHVFNILIDSRTAEVIHIDLGIAFDQGKTLRTPETVPFRLTRDIIAGFGCSGTEGIFRRCCEKTMQLLRDNQETLLTILEVLLCDPLYSWSVKTAQQNAPTSSRNTSTVCDTGTPSGLAKRALLVVTSKLSGTEDGVAGGVAVAGQVARLLHIATDPFNLCRLFHGWQPYL